MFIHLHVHSAFSLLDGAARLDDLIARAKALGMPALALTDHGLAGAIRFYQQAREAGIKPILGTEITVEGGGHLTLLAKDRQGYGHLCRLVSSANLRDPSRQSEPFVTHDELAHFSGRLVALSGCAKGEVAMLLAQGKNEEAAAAARRYHDIFGDNFYLELINHPCSATSTPVRQLVDLWADLHIPCVATNNVHYTNFGGHRLHEVLSCIGANTTLDHYPFPRSTEAYLTSDRARWRPASAVSPRPSRRAGSLPSSALLISTWASCMSHPLPRPRARRAIATCVRWPLPGRSSATGRCTTACSSGWKKSWQSSTSSACATTS